jgi:hypothetical protein
MCRAAREQMHLDVEAEGIEIEVSTRRIEHPAYFDQKLIMIFKPGISLLQAISPRRPALCPVGDTESNRKGFKFLAAHC